MAGGKVLGFLFLASALLGTACAAETEVASESDDVVAGGMTNLEAVARAKEWSDAKLAYCWAPNGGNNHKAGNYACSEICKRKSVKAWDPYRSDCSGLVSWAWGLPAPGRTTNGFFPFTKDITVGIAAKDLRPGDAVNNKTHVMLFKGWVTPGKRATFIEEPGCSTAQPYAREVTSDVTISGQTITPSGRGAFTAIRYTKLTVGEAKAAADAGSSSAGEEETEEETTPKKPATDAGTAPSPATAPPEEVTPATTGALDSVTCEGIEGWAMGKQSAAVDVELSFFAARGEAGAQAARTAANVRRSELPAAKADFGFVLPIPLAARDGKPHEVFAYAIDGKGVATALGAAKTFTCAPPALPMSADDGARRPVSTTTLAAWKRTLLEDVAKQPDEVTVAYGPGPELPSKPVAVQAEGSKDTFVVDGEIRRPIDASALAAWRLVPQKLPSADLEKLKVGPAWPKAPYFFQADDGTVWLLDAKALPETAGGEPSPEVVPTSSSGEATSGDGDGQPESAGRSTSSSSEDESDDDESGSSKKKKATASAGCSQTSRGSTSSPTAALLAIALGGILRRRSKPRGASR